MRTENRDKILKLFLRELINVKGLPELEVKRKGRG